MNNLSENIIRISEQAEKENEAERLKRRFNFCVNNNSSNNNTSSIHHSENQNMSENNSRKGSKNNNIPKNNSFSKIIPIPKSGAESKFDNNRRASNNSVTTNTQKSTNTILESKHKKSNSNIPVRINNVVNIVNNNYNNQVIQPMNKIRNSSFSDVNNDTERKCTQKIKLNIYENKNINTLFEKAINNISQRTNSMEFDDFAGQNYKEINSHNRYPPLSRDTEDMVPSEVDQVYYNQNDYIEKINMVGGSNKRGNQIKETTMMNKFIYGDDEVMTNQKYSGKSNYHSNNNSIDYQTYYKMKLFSKNAAYNLSNRILNDECKHHSSLKNTNYKFIENIREEKMKIEFFKTKSFWNLSDAAMFNILTFLFNQFDDLVNSNKLFGKKIYLTLNNQFENIISIFRNKYREILDLQEFYFKQSNLKRGRSIISIFDLVLKSKVISKEINQCIEISTTYNINNKEFIQSWKLDLRKKSDIGFWFASEAEEYNKHIFRHCYYQPIISFCKEDYVEFRINIFSRAGILDPFTLKWLDIIVYKTPEHSFLDFEKSLIKSNVNFDKFRCCELENFIHVWKGEKTLTNKNNIEEFKNFFQVNFKILNINYDFCKFYIFKVKMQANVIGCVKKNKFTNVDIEIKPYNESITNEIQCMGLLNINHLAKKVEIRVSTYVIFYFTDLYT